MFSTAGDDQESSDELVCAQPLLREGSRMSLLELNTVAK